jgi:histidinol dehydrogenase
MIRIMETCQVKTEDILKRETAATDMADKVAAEIIADVEARGDEALFEYCEKFDKVTLKALEVSQAEIDEAVNAVSDELKETMKKSAENIRFFHEKQVRNGFAITEKEGIILGQKITPIEKAGLYVPGGSASYPSSVLMNAIPAKIAGVSEIIMTTPVGRDGKIKDEILAAATLRVQPPTDKGKRLKIFYMTQASTRPPTFVCFVNNAELFHYSYQRYLENQIREVYGLEGTPVRFVIRERDEKSKH